VDLTLHRALKQADVSLVIRGLRIPALLATKVIGLHAPCSCRRTYALKAKREELGLLMTLPLPALSANHRSARNCEKRTKNSTEDDNRGQSRVGMKCTDQMHSESPRLVFSVCIAFDSSTHFCW